MLLHRALSFLCLFIYFIATNAYSSPIEVKRVTNGPQYHWFGYYDKQQLDPSGQYLLSMQVDFEDRSPNPTDVIKIGMVDLKNSNQWIELGTSHAWGWQQGCMLQWRPGQKQEVLWNDREKDRFVCRIYNLQTKETRTLPHPIYHLSPNGKHALGTDFARIQDQRPGYGYKGGKDPYANENAPSGNTIYLLDLETGERKDLISLADIAELRYPDGKLEGKLHFNHIQWNPKGNRFFFLTRVNGNNETISYTANQEGKDIRYVGKDSSHFEWRDEKHILIWARKAYRLYKDDGSGNNEVVYRYGNGHQSYIPTNKDWMVTDTYPSGPKREQTVFLYQFSTGKRIELGSFPSPKKYAGEWRCDTHPRISRDGKTVIIDSVHEGLGRQLYVIDIEGLIGS